MELEARGQYEGATARYAQALQKDPNHVAARERLFHVGQAAVAERLAEAAEWSARNDAVSAATQFQRADAIVAQARGVGVRFDLPDGYAADRRHAFDAAFTSLLHDGRAAHERGRWGDGVHALRRARHEFEPTEEQRLESLSAEGALLADWSADEYERGHLRAAYDVATRLDELEWAEAEDTERAHEVAQLALLEGQVELIVLPLQRASQGRRGQHELVREVDEILQAEHWRHAPAFVAMHDPLAVRDLLTLAGAFDGNHAPAAVAAILRLADADYGAHMELIRADETEYDVRSTTRTVRTHEGGTATFVEHKGKRRIRAEAKVRIIDPFGNTVSQLVVTAGGSAPFSRGEYDGDARELNLSSRQIGLFDRFEQAEQRRALHQALALDLANKLADAVYAPVLAQIP